MCCQPTQMSVVLMIFLRLVEDVMTLQTVPTQRRRDIVTALTSLMPSLFPCFIQTLHTNLELYRTKVNCRHHWCFITGDVTVLICLFVILLCVVVKCAC